MDGTPELTLIRYGGETVERLSTYVAYAEYVKNKVSLIMTCSPVVESIFYGLTVQGGTAGMALVNLSVLGDLQGLF